MKAARYVTVCVAILASVGFGCKLKAQNNNAGSKPDVHITVHKQTDKDGNVVSYDSEYTYTFKGNGMDSNALHTMMNMNGDSLPFLTHFKNGMPDFTNDPFFRNFDMSMNMDDMQKMMQNNLEQLMQSMGTSIPVIIQPAQPPAIHKKCPRQPGAPAKKCQPANNNSKEDVEI